MSDNIAILNQPNDYVHVEFHCSMKFKVRVFSSDYQDSSEHRMLVNLSLFYNLESSSVLYNHIE